MKKFTKLLGIVLIMALVMSIGTASFAANDGSITVTNATAGQTYEAYLIFTASPANPDDLSEGVTYTATEDQIAITGFTNIFDVIEDENGYYTVSKKTSGVTDDQVIAFIKANKDALAQGSAISGTVAADSTVTFDGLAYGYYYITSSLGTLISVDTAGKDVTVVDKNESIPTPPDKEITEEDSAIDESLEAITDTEDGNYNDSSIGSVETFTVTFNATNWEQSKDDTETQTANSGDKTNKRKILVWKFKDTPTNLEIDASTVVVTVNGVDVTSTITDKAIDATTGALTFNIPWVEDTSDATSNFLYETQTEGSALIPVVVTYNATVLPGAAVETAPNTVEVNYDNDNEQDKELGDDTTTTYTYKFKLKKTDENSAALDGAEFELYLGTTADDTAAALTFTYDEDAGAYRFDPDSSDTHIVATDGAAKVIGLDNGSYMLREVVVPSGYNKAEDTAVTGLSRVDVADADATEIEVQNLKGTLLPSTGGIGTTIFYVVGSILVVAAGVLLITKKRMSREG